MAASGPELDERGAPDREQAYKKADDKYKETLRKQAAKDALEIQIFFSVLTVATSGALGWISTAAAQASGGVETALRDAVESSVQATAGEVFSANGPLLFPPGGDGTVSPDPQAFQNDLQKRVNNVYKAALHVFGEVRTRYMNLPLEAWDTYDEAREKASFEKWQKDADELADDDDLPDGDWMARELERGRWAKYVRENHSYRDFGVFQTADTPDYVGADVQSHRITDLGVSQADSPAQALAAFAGPGHQSQGQARTDQDLGLGSALHRAELYRREEETERRRPRSSMIQAGTRRERGRTSDPGFRKPLLYLAELPRIW